MVVFRVIATLLCAGAVLSMRVEGELQALMSIDEQDEIEQSFHPNLNQCVQTLSKGKNDTDAERIYSHGTVTRDDGSEVPFEVTFSDGYKGRYARGELGACQAPLQLHDEVYALPWTSSEHVRPGDIGEVTDLPSSSNDGKYIITFQSSMSTFRIKAPDWMDHFMRRDHELAGGVFFDDRVVSKIDFNGKNEGERVRKGDVGVIIGPSAGDPKRVRADFPNFKKFTLAPSHFSPFTEERVRAPEKLALGTGTVYSSAGEACLGGTDNTGTCTGAGGSVKCYNSDHRSTYAANGALGICLVAHQHECKQRIAGDGTSGTCEGGTTCRKFRFWQHVGSARLGDLTMSANAKAQVESFCVNPDPNDSDNRLVFLNAHGYHSIVMTVSPKRIYNTD